MAAYYYNGYVAPRKVQCPECGHESISRRENCQCSVKECRFRFRGNDHIYKTQDDRLKERQEIFKILEEMESRLENEVRIISELKQKLKPLIEPKLKDESLKMRNKSIEILNQLDRV